MFLLECSCTCTLVNCASWSTPTADSRQQSARSRPESACVLPLILGIGVGCCGRPADASLRMIGIGAALSSFAQVNSCREGTRSCTRAKIACGLGRANMRERLLQHGTGFICGLGQIASGCMLNAKGTLLLTSAIGDSLDGGPFMVYTSCHGFTIQGRAGFCLGRPFALGCMLGAKDALHASLRHGRLSRWGVYSWCIPHATATPFRDGQVFV